MLVPMAKHLASRVAPGGLLLLSGILVAAEGRGAERVSRLRAPGRARARRVDPARAAQAAMSIRAAIPGLAAGPRTLAREPLASSLSRAALARRRSLPGVRSCRAHRSRRHHRRGVRRRSARHDRTGAPRERGGIGAARPRVCARQRRQGRCRRARRDRARRDTHRRSRARHARSRRPTAIAPTRSSIAGDASPSRPHGSVVAPTHPRSTACSRGATRSTKRRRTTTHRATVRALLPLGERDLSARADAPGRRARHSDGVRDRPRRRSHRRRGRRGARSSATRRFRSAASSFAPKRSLRRCWAPSAS